MHVIVPNPHSTNTRTEFIWLLNVDCSGVRMAPEMAFLVSYASLFEVVVHSLVRYEHRVLGLIPQAQTNALQFQMETLHSKTSKHGCA